MSSTSPPVLPGNPAEPRLARTMGLWALIIYGVGDMLGAGIYALVGKAAGVMGNAIWLSFLVSMVAALLTGLSYASIGSRYPRAAGAAYVSHRAFAQPFLSYMVGLAVMASGLTSMATQSRAFASYAMRLVGPGPWTQLALILGFILVLTLINFWGMRESTWLNLVCTTIEAAGLVIVLVVGLRYWGSVNYLQMPAAPADGPAWGGLLRVLQGSVLTFYAFIGFEDMLNVSEEVKDVRRTFPRAMIIAIAITSIIYMAVSITAVSVVPHQELAAAEGPLVEVVHRAAPRINPVVFTIIALFAITNTALLNYIMGSRLVYGMARLGFVPRLLGRVHPTRRTPHFAILALMCIVIVLAFSGDIGQLASATSALLLYVFVIVNSALIVLKLRKDEPRGAFEVPVWVPAGGILVCLAILTQVGDRAVKIAFLLIVGITVLFLIARPKVTEEALGEQEG